ENEARRTHRALRLGGVAEIEEELVELPELAPREKKSLLACRRLRRALPNPDHREQVAHDDGEIESVEAAEDHRFSLRENLEWWLSRGPCKCLGFRAAKTSTP